MRFQRPLPTYSDTWHITAADVASAPVATLSRQICGKHPTILICMLVVGVDMNLHPTRRATLPANAAGARNITVGALKSRTMAHKAAKIHLIIEDERLEVLSLSENLASTGRP